jgi:hypothetical protein
MFEMMTRYVRAWAATDIISSMKDVKPKAAAQVAVIEDYEIAVSFLPFCKVRNTARNS